MAGLAWCARMGIGVSGTVAAGSRAASLAMVVGVLLVHVLGVVCLAASARAAGPASAPRGADAAMSASFLLVRRSATA